MIELTRTRFCHERYCRAISDGSLSLETAGAESQPPGNMLRRGFTLLDSTRGPFLNRTKSPHSGQRRVDGISMPCARCLWSLTLSDLFCSMVEGNKVLLVTYGTSGSSSLRLHR